MASISLLGPLNIWQFREKNIKIHVGIRFTQHENNLLFPAYLDLFDVVLDVFNGVSVDVIADVNLMLADQLRPDNCKQTTSQPPLYLRTKKETGLWSWVHLYLI